MTQPNTKYPGAMRAIHWLMALIIISLIAVGWYMAELPDDAINKYDLYPWHKSFGLLVLCLLAARVLVRLTSVVPVLPAALQQWEKSLAKLGHVSLYILMLIAPGSGYLMSAAYPVGNGVQFFGLQLPDIIGKSEDLSGLMHEVHEVSVWLLLLVIIIHVAGALKHRFIDKNPAADVLGRML